MACMKNLPSFHLDEFQLETGSHNYTMKLFYPLDHVLLV